MADSWELPEYLKVKTNFSWVLDIIDYFTKYLLSFPLVKNDADNVLLGIKEFVYTIGIPNILQTDNGSEFVNNKVKNFCEKNKILFIQSRPRNPKCNGIIEVSHKEIRKYVLTKFAIQEENEEEIFDLRDVLLEACNTHNNNVHTETGKKPVDLIKNNDHSIYLKVLKI